MDISLLQQVAKEVASQINQRVNLPFIKEDEEQVFFESIVLLILQVLVAKFSRSLKDMVDTHK